MEIAGGSEPEQDPARHNRDDVRKSYVGEPDRTRRIGQCSVTENGRTADANLVGRHGHSKPDRSVRSDRRVLRLRQIDSP